MAAAVGFVGGNGASLFNLVLEFLRWVNAVLKVVNRCEVVMGRTKRPENKWKT